MFDRAESTLGTESNWQQTWIMRVSAFCVAYVLMAYCTFFFLDRETFIKLTIEDSLFENLGAIYFLLTAVIFFLNVLLYRHVVHTDEAIIKKSVWYILFVIAFFLRVWKKLTGDSGYFT